MIMAAERGHPFDKSGHPISTLQAAAKGKRPETCARPESSISVRHFALSGRKTREGSCHNGRGL